MIIDFFATRWGSEQLSWTDFFDKVKTAGYDGVEIGLSADMAPTEKLAIAAGIEKFKLKWIGQHWQTVDADYNRHCTNFERELYSLAEANPLFINSQTGKDYFTEKQNTGLIKLANKISEATNVKIIHETHRGKWSFAAHVTRQYLEKYPDIRLTLDVSHWCVVAESLLHDQAAAVELAIQHTDHIHARIGYQQGAQVTDPRSPEYEETLDWHLSCWDKVIELQQALGNDSFTITPEFGPYPYLAHLPYTGQPVADQWAINVFMMTLLKNRYHNKNN